MTHAGTEPATFRFVVRHLNQCHRGPHVKKCNQCNSKHVTNKRTIEKRWEGEGGGVLGLNDVTRKCDVSESEAFPHGQFVYVYRVLNALSTLI